MSLMSKKLLTKNRPGVKTKLSAGPKESKELTYAKEAVKKFEGMRDNLEAMRAEFEGNHPEAIADLQAVRLYEDDVRNFIEKTKLLVKDAKQSIGEFTLKMRYAKAGYDPNKVLEMLKEQEDWDFLGTLLDRGAVKSVSLDSDVTKMLFDMDDERRERYSRAWKDKEELSPAVSVPKI